MWQDQDIDSIFICRRLLGGQQSYQFDFLGSFIISQQLLLSILVLAPGVNGTFRKPQKAQVEWLSRGFIKHRRFLSGAESGLCCLGPHEAVSFLKKEYLLANINQAEEGAIERCSGTN